MLMVAGVALYVAAPLFGSRSGGQKRARNHELDQLIHERALAVQAIRELEFDREMNKLSNTDYRILRAQIDARALDAMTAIERLRAKPPEPPMAKPEPRAAKPAPPPAKPTPRPRPQPPEPQAASDSARPRAITFCPQCGAPVMTGARFCVECGRRHLCTARCTANGCVAGLCVHLVRDGVTDPRYGVHE